MTRTARVLLWVRAIAYMFLVGGIQFIALPALLLAIDAGTLVPIIFRSGLALVAGSLLVILGVTLAVLSAVYLVRFGHGTPFPLDPTRVLVRNGPYRYVRNPQAVAATLIVLGECLLLESRLGWPVLPITVVYLEWLAAPIEDRQLRRQFGEEYLAYRREVARWLPRRIRQRDAGPATVGGHTHPYPARAPSR